MAGLNKVLLIGHVGRDPELKYTPTGAAVANFTVATTEQWKNKEGKQEEKTEWHKIVVWNKLAEVMGQYLKKGQQVFIEGSLQTRSWDDDKGQKRYITEIRASSVQFLGKKGDNAGATPESEPQTTNQDVPQDKPQPGGEEDLPF